LDSITTFVSFDAGMIEKKGERSITSVKNHNEEHNLGKKSQRGVITSLKNQEPALNRG
jgi:hypothetical protein